MDISVLILAKNEQKMIEECLKQLSFAKEVIVLDQNSTDKTKDIAKKYTDKIFDSESDDFSINRNLLLSKSNCEWVLYLDCDERLNEEVIEEIKNALKNDEFKAYYFPRKNMILGNWVKHGGWWPDYAPRLFKRMGLVEWYGRVHESPKVNGKMGYFKTPLTHLTARTVNVMLEKTIKWAKVEAEIASKNNHPKVTEIKVVKAMVFEFYYRYFRKLGVLDGKYGLIEAIFQALHKAISLTYLWEIQNMTTNSSALTNFEKNK